MSKIEFLYQKEIRITRDDYFVWKIVSADEAKKIFLNDVFPLYLIKEDDSEHLIETLEELNDAIDELEDIGIEVGFIKHIEKK